MKTKNTTLPKPSNPPDNFYDAILKWTGNRLNPRSSFYSGRGPKRGDLSEDHLELIFRGIKFDFSDTHAAVFIRFVSKLDDLSATAFLVAFESFYSGGCSDADCRKPSSKAEGFITSHDDNGRYAEGMAGIMAVLGNNVSDEMQQMESDSIKRAFLMQRGQKMPKGKRSNIYNCGPFD